MHVVATEPSLTCRTAHDSRRSGEPHLRISTWRTRSTFEHGRGSGCRWCRGPGKVRERARDRRAVPLRRTGCDARTSGSTPRPDGRQTRRGRRPVTFGVRGHGRERSVLSWQRSRRGLSVTRHPDGVTATRSETTATATHTATLLRMCQDHAYGQARQMVVYARAVQDRSSDPVQLRQRCPRRLRMRRVVRRDTAAPKAMIASRSWRSASRTRSETRPWVRRSRLEGSCLNMLTSA